MLILPGDPRFDFTLAYPPPIGSAQEDIAFIADSQSGILRAATRKEVEEYLFGGEYDERLQQIEASDCKNFQEDDGIQ